MPTNRLKRSRKLVGEPNRQNFNAIIIAGAAFLNGGFGIWEFAFSVMVTYCTFRGLRSYSVTIPETIKTLVCGASEK